MIFFKSDAQYILSLQTISSLQNDAKLILCHTPLTYHTIGMTLDNQKIEALESELSLLKTQFTARINNLEHKLHELTASAAQEDIQVTPPASEATSNDFVVTRTNAQPSTTVEIEETVTPPSFLKILFDIFMSSLFDWFEPAVKIYKSYQRRGMLGIFILTILGIGLTLAGFGYLMQLLIDQLGSGAKSLLMLGAALGVMALGVLIKKKTSLYEFSTAIVALGILLLYSTVYFAGSVYSVIPYTTVVVLYLLIAFSAHAIALWLDTKVVAALGIIGISIMPMLSDIIVAHPGYYLISLALVTVSSLIIASRYVGLWLAHLSLTFVLMSLEWVIYLDGANLSVIFINLFYLLFFVYICLALIQRTAASHLQSLLFLAVLVGANLLFLLQTTSLFSDSISIALVINSLVAVSAAYIFFKQQHIQTHFIVLVATIWALLTVVSLIGEAYWGIAWAVKGLLLIYLGRRYLLPKIIHQGQVLTAVSLLYCTSALAPYLPAPALTSFDGWILSVSMVIMIRTWLCLIDEEGSFNTFTINKVRPVLMLLESIWLTLLAFFAAYLLLGNWAFSLIILGQFALLIRAHKTQQTNIDIFAAVLIFLPVFYIVNTALITHSHHFSLLPLTAKFATVSIFAQLWLFAEFYRRYPPISNQTDNIMVKIAEGARIGFYLIMPLFWISSAIRHLEQNALILMWLPPVIALCLALKIKHKWIIIQTQMLIVLSSLTLLVAVCILPILTGLITLSLFIIFYGAAFILNKRTETPLPTVFSGLIHTSLYQYISTFGLFSVGFALPLWVLNIDGSLLFAMMTAAFYWSVLFNRTTEWLFAKPLSLLVNTISAGLILIAWLLMFDSPWYVLVPVIYLIAALYQKEQCFNHSILGKLLDNNSDLGLHAMAAISYILLLLSLDQYDLDLFIAPALAIHGALILFIKDRRLSTIKFSFALIFIGIIKLALVDAESVLLWQKVMLFMGIGIFILGASFWYQKLISATEEAEN